MRYLFAFIIFLLPLFAQESVKIGVLAKRGTEIAHKKWDATAAYLTRTVPEYRFEIVPLGFDELRQAVSEERIDFVLTNTMYYVDLEYRYGVSRIATLVNRFQHDRLTRFGGVIITRAERSDITSLHDIPGKRFGAVDPFSFGGWVMARYEMEKEGIHPEKLKVTYLHSHDNVVNAVLSGTVDVGTVRTDTLERMAAEQAFHLEDLRIIDPKRHEEFPFVHSTRLYPEWPFARLKSTPIGLSNRVLSALLMLDENDPAAEDAQIAGWAIPLDYNIVHEVLRELQLSPYEHYGEITLSSIYATYTMEFYAVIGTFLTILIILSYILYLNRSLHEKGRTIALLNANLESKVSDRTRKISKMYEEEQELRQTVDAIMNAQENMVLLSDGRRMLKANQALYNVTGHRDLQHFHSEYDCICQLFVKEEGYLYKITPDFNWLAYIDEHHDREHKVKMYDHSKHQYRIFLIKDARSPFHGEDLHIITMTDISELEDAYRSMSFQAMTDELTGIYNRRHFLHTLAVEYARVQRDGGTFSMVMFDLDHFKRVNDTYGHSIGDKLLKSVVSLVRKHIRESDTFARWGGEEFIILAPGMSLHNAYLTAEKLRLKIEACTFETIGNITASFGIVEYREGCSEESLINRVDAMLYEAKHAGRNRVEPTVESEATPV